MSLIYKILSVIAGAITLFFVGVSTGRKKEKEKELISENDELQKDIKTLSKVNNNDNITDNLEFLLSKQQSKNKK